MTDNRPVANWPYSVLLRRLLNRKSNGENEGHHNKVNNKFTTCGNTNFDFGGSDLLGRRLANAASMFAAARRAQNVNNNIKNDDNGEWSNFRQAHRKMNVLLLKHRISSSQLFFRLSFAFYLPFSPALFASLIKLVRKRVYIVADILC